MDKITVGVDQSDELKKFIWFGDIRELMKVKDFLVATEKEFPEKPQILTVPANVTGVELVLINPDVEGLKCNVDYFLDVLIKNQ